QRDAQDRAKINEWLNDHPPFPQINLLMSLSTGLIGNEKINCHQALQIGTAIMQNFVGCKFGEMKQSRKHTVMPLASMSCTIKIGGEKATINPLTIFQRTLIAKKSDADVERLLEYELSPFPLSLFNEGGMRKGTKSTLYSVLPEEENSH
ncbi:hypothetical protein, partial [Klebsiella pneumoniae]|uniref:hypothetical protein n=1 Tax=Klebsiella pneumoniae TaxID=573 RepID=UPI0040556E38